MFQLTIFIISAIFYQCCCFSVSGPLVLNTWKFTNANKAVLIKINKNSVKKTTLIICTNNGFVYKQIFQLSSLKETTYHGTRVSKAMAWDVINRSGSALNAVEEGCLVCEAEQCDGTVGYGGSPDESGETTLDAMIFDGDTMNVGAVGDLRRVKSAISVARSILEYTTHSLIVGDAATSFARSMGFKEESLSTNVSLEIWSEWKKKNCQPNFWIKVEPDPKEECGPYSPYYPKSDNVNIKDKFILSNYISHDTIGIIAIDKNISFAAGTSSNGARFKIPGRVGDAPIPGSGAFADSSVGAAVETGDGDIMMRFSPASTIVEMMRLGISPQSATTRLIARIVSYYPQFNGAILAVNKKGEFAAACHGFPIFPFSLSSEQTNGVKVYYVKCI